MNPAAEHIILWHLNRSGISEDEIAAFMPALSRGYELRQSDALELVNQYVEIARATSVGLEEEEIIEILYRLHRHYEAIADDERMIVALEKVRTILNAKKNGPLNDRIIKAKIAAIETELVQAGRQ